MKQIKDNGINQCLSDIQKNESGGTCLQGRVKQAHEMRWAIENDIKTLLEYDETN